MSVIDEALKRLEMHAARTAALRSDDEPSTEIAASQNENPSDQVTYRIDPAEHGGRSSGHRSTIMPHITYLWVPDVSTDRHEEPFPVSIEALMAGSAIASSFGGNRADATADPVTAEPVTADPVTAELVTAEDQEQEVLEADADHDDDANSDESNATEVHESNTDTIADEDPHADGESNLLEEPSMIKLAPTARDATSYEDIAVNIMEKLQYKQPADILFLAIDTNDEWSDAIQQVASSLAEQLDDPILAIDTSVNARLTRHFGVEPHRALDEVLNYNCSWSDRIVQTGTPGLSLLPTDDQPVHLDEQSLSEMLEDLHQRYATVVIDGGAIDHYGAEPLGVACGGSFLLVRLLETSKDQAEAARKNLQDWGVKLLGAVAASYDDTPE